MVNPDISLFHPVPEGSLTYQPNPNSIVQNDEARGVDHLDFFRFVGRMVGKALFDGQYIDAYFTRSFYKHMLGQRLTYQVPPAEAGAALLAGLPRCSMYLGAAEVQHVRGARVVAYVWQGECVPKCPCSSRQPGCSMGSWYGLGIALQQTGIRGLEVCSHHGWAPCFADYLNLLVLRGLHSYCDRLPGSDGLQGESLQCWFL